MYVVWRYWSDGEIKYLRKNSSVKRYCYVDSIDCATVFAERLDTRFYFNKTYERSHVVLKVFILSSDDVSKMLNILKII